MGATLLLGGAGALGGLDMAMAQSSLLPVETMQRNAVDYDKVANVSGDFTFCQDVVTPADEVFNLFGTATTALCAKPGYAFDAVTHESYYLNIGGNVEKVYTVGLDEIERMDSKIQKMRCTCGMSPALAMASVKGVKVSDMLSMTDIAPEVNTITFKDKDGSMKSRIRPTLQPGSVVTDTRVNTMYVVTEYGCVCLKGLSVWERAEKLISIAHPDFREELIREAEKQKIWYPHNRR